MGMLEHYWTWFKTSWCVIYIYICIYKYICIHTNIHWIDIVWPHFKASHFQKNHGNEISEGSWASVDSLDSLERLSYWPATKSKNIYIHLYAEYPPTWDLGPQETSIESSTNIHHHGPRVCWDPSPCHKAVAKFTISRFKSPWTVAINMVGETYKNWRSSETLEYMRIHVKMGPSILNIT